MQKTHSCKNKVTMCNIRLILMQNICGFGSCFDSSVSSVHLDMKEVLYHELAGVPLSMLDESRDMGISSYITLKNIH